MAAQLSPDRVPATVRSLVQLAERWGIGDDFEREALVAEASEDSLRELASALDEAGDDFWEWLAGPESYEEEPSPEYTAFTCLSMAVDSARVKLQNRGVG